MKQRLLSVLLILCLTVCLPLPLLGHAWQEATCTTPKICTNCETVDGDALGHTWNFSNVIPEPTMEAVTR